jgi:hypothetical protein
MGARAHLDVMLGEHCERVSALVGIIDPADDRASMAGGCRNVPWAGARLKSTHRDK